MRGNKGGGNNYGTYNLGIETGSGRTVDDSMIELVLLGVIFILQRVEKLEEVEGERRRRTVNRCWKPTYTHELCAPRKAIGGTATTAIPDNKTVGTAEVEYYEILKRRGVGTRITPIVPELYNEAESG